MKILGPATPEEVAAAFDTRAGTTYKRTDADQKQHRCKRCERTFFAAPKAWILSSLCDPCFAEADREKWDRRVAVAETMGKPCTCEQFGNGVVSGNDGRLPPAEGCPRHGASLW